MRWVRSTDILAGLALFFSSIFFFYDLLGGRNILFERDLGPYFIPPRFFWVESIKNGEFPLWNPYQFSGHPFFANLQHAILYPLNTLFFLLPFDVAFNTIIILHFFLGGFFTYLFLKDLKVNTTGSLISGLIFMLSGYLLSVHSLLAILLSVIWTPLIMMFFRRAVTNPGLKNEILTAIFITLSFLGGGIEIVYGNFFVLVFMVIFFSPEGEAQTYRQWKRIWLGIRSLFIISILSSLLSAVQLLPFLELFHHSIRGGGISYQEATIWSFSPKDVLLFFLPDAYGYFLDMKKYWINQCWFKTLYTGGLVFILSLIFFLAPHSPLSPSEEKEGRLRSIASATERVRNFAKERKFYLSLAVFSLFLSLGGYNPLYPFVFKYVPFFNGIRYPVKFLYIFILVLAISAGLGFQRLSEFSKKAKNQRLKHILIIFSCASGFFLLFLVIDHKAIEQFLKLKGVDFPDFNYLLVNLHHLKRFFFYLTLFFLLLRVGYEVRWKGWVKVLLLIFLTADLFGNMGFYGKEKTSAYFKKTKILEMISSDKGHFRIFSTEKTTSLDTPILVDDISPLRYLKEKHLPSLDLLYSLHDIWGIDVIRLKRTDDLYKAFISTPSISATHLVDLYNVKYVISAPPIEKNPRFELICSKLEGLRGKKEDLLKENTVKLYRARKHFPRAWLVKNFKVLDAHAILLRMLTKEFLPYQEVLLEEEPYNPPTSSFSKGGPRGITKGRMKELGGPLSELQNKVEFISETNNMVHLRVRAKEDALLVLSDTYYPGWKAFVYPVRYDSYSQINPVDTNLSNGVNGRKEKIFRADYNFRAVPLRAGDYEVKFIYDPITFKIGMVISSLTLIGVILFFINRGPSLSFSRKREPRREKLLPTGRQGIPGQARNDK